MRRRVFSLRTRRTGFTLVELMVAMALIIFIMYVLAEAFSAGAKTFRDLKGIGDLNARLRTATTILRQYLAADHFEGRKRLSDKNFWAEGPPRQGFFRIWQDAAGFDEGEDLDSDTNDSNHSYRTDYDSSKPNDPVGHHLHFTVRLRGDRLTDFFKATVPSDSPLLSLPEPALRYQETGSNEYRSQWAEILVFLKRTSEETEDPNGSSGSPLQLYSLHLQQRLLVPSNKDVEDAGNGQNPATWPVDVGQASNYSEISQTTDPATTTQLYFNGPDDVTMPARRSGNNTTQNVEAYALSPGALSRASDGSDVLLTDVLAFDVRVLLPQSAYTGTAREEFVSLFSTHCDKYRMMVNGEPATLGLGSGNSELGRDVRVFDTWSSRKDNEYDYTNWKGDSSQRSAVSIPMYQQSSGEPIRIRAIKITIRIWDPKTKQSRQVSMIQDL